MGALNLGMVALANRVWLDWLDVPVSASPLFPLLSLSLLLLLAGPVAALVLRPLRRTLRGV